MNAGLSNLATLKAWLLTAAMRAANDYDDAILAIGRGVAASLERHCNREFARTVGATIDCTADRLHVRLPRYPVEAITKVELRTSLEEGWIDQGAVNSVIENISTEAGIAYLAAELGGSQDRLRLTYTGGFTWEQLEPEDVGYPTAQPAGATALPADVLLAWLLQCEHVWTQRDKLGLAIADKPSEIYSGALQKIELLPVVREHLAPFMRYALL